MKNKTKTLSFLAAFIAMAFTPIAIFAQEIKLQVVLTDRKINNYLDYVVGIFGTVVIAAAIVAVVMIIYAGLQWTIAAGDAGKIKAARERISNAVLGLLLMLLSIVILGTVNQSINQPSVPSLLRPAKFYDSKDVETLSPRGAYECPAGTVIPDTASRAVQTRLGSLSGASYFKLPEGKDVEACQEACGTNNYESLSPAPKKESTNTDGPKLTKKDGIFIDDIENYKICCKCKDLATVPVAYRLQLQNYGLYDKGDDVFNAISVSSSKTSGRSPIIRVLFSENSITNYLQYLQEIYRFGMVIVSILAVVMIIYGGITWTTSFGIPEKIKKAQGIIAGAIIGLLLILGSYIILNTLNPQILNDTIPNIQQPNVFIEKK